MRFVALSLLLFAAPAWALTPTPLPEGEGKGVRVQSPIFTLEHADGREAKGSLDTIEDGWTVTLRADERVSTKGTDIIGLRRSEAHRPPPPSGEHVILVNGDRIPGEVRELTGERLCLRTPLAEQTEIAIPLSTLSVVWLGSPGGAEDSDTLPRRWLQAKRTQDTLFLRNGDIVEGVLTGLNRQQATVEAAQKEVQVPFDKIAFIAFNTELLRKQLPQGLHGKLILTDGARLTVPKAAYDGQAVLAETDYQAKLRIPLRQIAAIDFVNGRAVYLSDRQPLRYEFTSYFGTIRWPYRKDASVVGRALRLGENYYDKGLGMHTRSRITYELAGNYRRFESVVGLDERSGRRGAALIRILVDGKPRDLKEAAQLTGGERPRHVRIDVTGAKELTLINEFGPLGDVQGHVDWANARLVK